MNDMFSRILYISEDCVAVNKLCGEALEGAGQGMGDMPRLLADALAAAGKTGGDLALPAAAHRLDVPVTGCAVFARTRAALKILSGAFAEDIASGGSHLTGVTKRYWAIAEKPPGGPLSLGGDIVHWIQFDSRKNKSFAYGEPGPGRKKAVLRCRPAGEGKNYLFLEIELLTGRHHQIRAQLAGLGLHIKGDLKYGARRSEKNGGIRLHARSVSFPDPQSGGRITVQAEPPLRDNLWLAFEEAVLA
ncbi:MAG: RNA pseudouridine synthase [Treponema sp.]|jgi:23S rRNA pseudouridine1911/1915/1917 synthase|nr:RNA pseudouridine synthase [Treponema sp.]